MRLDIAGQSDVDNTLNRDSFRLGTPPMATIPKKRSLADMQRTGGPVPQEFNDTDYDREVLQLEGTCETVVDEALAREAITLGVDISQTFVSSQIGHVSVCDSMATVGSEHLRTSSMESEASASTGITSLSSNERSIASMPPITRKITEKRPLSFSAYDRLLSQLEAQEQVRIEALGHTVSSKRAPSIFSVSTQKSYNGMKSSFKSHFKLRRNKASTRNLISCVCCRDEFKANKALHTLPCSHRYCEKCLQTLIKQASSEESRMPPKCCGKPIHGHTIKSVLTREEQHSFLKSVLQFSTPWEERIFCPNAACGEFVPRRHKIDPKHPFEVQCKQCGTRACSMCKRGAHRVGQDCPADKDLEVVLEMGEKNGWRRCFNCRNLIELTQGCSHITCRCKAEFCYICEAAYDPVIGCPNYCDDEEELERRRVEEAARAAQEAAEKSAQEAATAALAAKALEAIKRSEKSEELKALRERQANERDRFISFRRDMKTALWNRHGQTKIDILARYEDLQVKMKERHAKTAVHLEDRQVAAEMELRVSLKQSERSVHIRLRHMEAYCEGVGRASSGPNPARTVTERDLRELSQQYNLKNDIERLHQSRINVMREKQGRQMEQLLMRQEEELEKLAIKQAGELEAHDEAFGDAEEQFTELFRARKERLMKRWVIVEEVCRIKMEARDGVRYAKLGFVEWPQDERREEALEAVAE